jgi:hypothetical protein
MKDELMGIWVFCGFPILAGLSALLFEHYYHKQRSKETVARLLKRNQR